MKKKEKKRRPLLRTMTAIGWRLWAFALAFWLVAMGLITHCIAIELYNQMQVKTYEFAQQYAFINLGSGKGDAQLPGYTEYQCIDNLAAPFRFSRLQSASPVTTKVPSMISDDDNDAFIYDVAISYKIGDLKLDTNGHYLSFAYMTAEQWKSAESLEEKHGFAYIDLTKLDTACYTREDANLLYFNANWGPHYNAGRFTGYFDGNEFVPISVDYCPSDDDAILYLEEKGWIRWYNIYQAPIPEDRELVTIYAADEFGPGWIFGIGARDMGPVTVDGKTYTQLEDTLPWFADKDSLLDAVVITYNNFTNISGEKIHVRVALRAQPLPHAMKILTWFYILSFAVMALAVWLIKRSIERNLVKPVAQIATYSTDEPKLLPEHKRSHWQEPRLLQENYEAIADAHHRTSIELRQLQTALDYAQNAERKRREMVSNITHELKTPLAVIHSYAEGLKEGIAADKQEKYLTVIQEEAARMDAMVLEMLDLSRLEAGKVRFSSDRFSLLELTHSIFDRLAPMAQEKNLQIHYHIVEKFLVTADEGRIGQVITNFATNAIKYTPEGGQIWIKVYRFREKSILSIENECEPLSEEALAKVWDSFYRAETSRTTKGTGLGLSIAKTIIELHGGSVAAGNTGSGVAFQFTLP